MRSIIFVTFSATVLWIAAALGGMKPVDLAAINNNVHIKHLQPRYVAFAGRAQRLNTAVKQLCRRMTPAGLAATRRAFHDAVDAWQSIEHFRSGPANEHNAHARLNFWPDRRGRVGKHLRRLLVAPDTSRLTPKIFAQGSVAVQGFTALERLLFGEETGVNLNSGGAVPRSCAIAVAISGNIDALSGSLAEIVARDPFGKANAKEVTATIFNDLATGLGAVADLKLGSPLGIKSGRVRQKRAEHWRSGRALRNIVLNLTALRDLYVIIADGAGRRLSGSPEDQLIREQFNTVIRDANAAGPTLATALEDVRGQARLKALHASIGDLRELVIIHVSEALGLTLGFNSLDGD